MALKNLRKFRKDNDMSQKELATILGMSQVNYSRYEKGQRNPDLTVLQKIVKRINVSGSFLLDHDESEHTIYISENADMSLDINLSCLHISPVQSRYLARKIFLLVAEFKKQVALIAAREEKENQEKNSSKSGQRKKPQKKSKKAKTTKKTLVNS